MKKVILIAFFILIIALIQYFDVQHWFTFENLKLQQDSLSLYVQENHTTSVMIFIFIYIVSVAFMIPIATILTLAGGFLFGLAWGLLFVNIGATIGATLAFLFARYIMGATIQKRYATQLQRFNKALEENQYRYLFSLRLLPIFPFFLVNFLCGVTTISLRVFCVTTALGILPGSFVYVYAGVQLATLEGLEDIFSIEILSALVLLALLILMPVLMKKFRFNSK